MRTALKSLMKRGMITATKTTRGIHVTICYYDNLQDPKSYEARNETKVEYRHEAGTKPKPNPLLYQKEQKEIRNNKERKKEEPVSISDDDYNIHIETNSYNAKKGKYEKVESGGRVEVEKRVTSVILVSKRWMPAQPEGIRYLVASAIKNIGYEQVLLATKHYADGMSAGDYDNPITSARYWWTDGIYNHLSKSQVKSAEQIKKDTPIKRRCNICHKTQEFMKGTNPMICPLCNEGALLSQVEYYAEFPVDKPATEPKPQVLDYDDQQAKDNVDRFLKMFNTGGSV